MLTYSVEVYSIVIIVNCLETKFGNSVQMKSQCLCLANVIHLMPGNQACIIIQTNLKI